MTVLSNIITPSNVLTTTNTATVTNKTFGDNPTFSGGTANGVTYLNGSKVLTSGSALVFDGSNLGIGTSTITSGSGFTPRLVLSASDVALIVKGQNSQEASVGSSNSMYIDCIGAATGTNNNIVFRNNSTNSSFATTERMRITSAGDVGIGTSSPQLKFVVSNGGAQGFEVNPNSGIISGGIDILCYNRSAAAYKPIYTNAEYHVWATSTTERARIDSSGRLGIGQSSPNATLVVEGTSNNIDTNIYINQVIKSATAYDASPRAGLGFSVKYNSTDFVYGASIQGYKNNATINDYGVGLLFTTQRNGNAPAQRMTLDSEGNLFVDCTDYPNGSTRRGFEVLANSGVNDTTKIAIGTTTTSTRALIEFNNGNGNVGSINTSGSTTNYVTSSDYRLKNTIAPMTGALAKVALLKPVTYKWNADGSNGEGFIAHELAEVCPQAVSGEKDAVDADGNIKSQGIDTSFLVATLTAALQELNAKFEAYVASHP